MRYLALLLLLACSSPTEPGPPNIILESATTWTNPEGVTVTTTLRNDGGPGQYRLEFWALPNGPGGSVWLVGDTDAVTVGEGYRETVEWFMVGSGSVIRVDAFVRSGSAGWTLTDRLDL